MITVSYKGNRTIKIKDGYLIKLEPKISADYKNKSEKPSLDHET